MKYLLSFLLSFLFFQFAVNSPAQQSLINDSSFFYSKITEIDELVENMGLNQFYHLSGINISDDKVHLFFDANQTRADSAIAAWLLLKTKFDSGYDYRVANTFFNTIAFDLELGKDSLEIVLGANIEDFKVYLNFEPGKGLVVNEEYKAPKRTFKSLIIKYDDLNLADASLKTKGDQVTMKGIRAAIGNYLRNFYKDKGTFFYDAQLDVLKENSNELTFEISKLSKEILNDRNYFEFIRIEVKILKADKDFEIKYQVQGKYGSGFGFVPRSSEYRNMEPSFSDYLNRYEEKLAQNINQILIK
ncbi:MAG: hypothetical protein U0W24_23760 [Bacteroidales bacterium]